MENDTSESSSVNQFDELAAAIAQRWYGGTLLRCPAVIVEAVLKATPMPEVPPAVLEESKKRFADALLVALNDRIRAQDAAASQFKN
jgi:hypothetical protein